MLDLPYLSSILLYVAVVFLFIGIWNTNRKINKEVEELLSDTVVVETVTLKVVTQNQLLISIEDVMTGKKYFYHRLENSMTIGNRCMHLQDWKNYYSEDQENTIVISKIIDILQSLNINIQCT